jgi:5-carboxymethyl-2-hydroxymuconate isomerase/acylpyruvate hydrolase
MRLLTFTPKHSSVVRIGVRLADQVLDLSLADAKLPTSMKTFLEAGASTLAKARQLEAAALASPDAYAHALCSVASITYLPVIPDSAKFLCVGKNYRTHLEELKRTDLIKEIPQEPTGFIKTNECLSGHEATVKRPATVSHLDYEPELVFVMSKRAFEVKKTDAGFNAMDYVIGVTVLNDLTCRDTQKREVASGSRFWTSKNAPGFGPLGPEIVTMDEIADPYDLWMTCSVNGEERMRVNTNDQIWKLPDILEHFSRLLPLNPGDMFSTGAPGGVAVGKPNAEALYLQPGDVIECAIEGITTLRTYIS